MNKSDKVPVVLALGGGAARGLAHIGIIEVLEENGIEIKGVAGTSIGSCIGGLYAGGQLEEFKEYICELDVTGMLKMLDPVLPRAGIFAGDRIGKKLQEFLPNKSIDDLKLPFCAVSTEISSGTEIIHDTGPMIPAIRASMAIPGIFKPIKIKEKWLVDGGVSSPVPISAARKLLSGLPIIAVNLFNTDLPFQGHVKQNMDDSAKDLGKLEKLLLKMRQSSPDGRPGLFATLSDTIAHMEQTLCRFQIAAQKPELLIEPAVFGVGLFDFYNANQIIEAGTQCAQKIVSSGELDAFKRRYATSHPK